MESLLANRPERDGPETARLESERAPVFPLAASLIARDAESLARFYVGTLGFERIAQAGDTITLGAGGVGFLHIAHRPGARRHDGRGAGLFHNAFLLPDRAGLARWFLATRAAGARFEGASDHAVSEAFYLTDPEGNGIEIYVDRPRAQWPREAGGYAMTTGPMALDDLLAGIAPRHEPPHLPAGTRLGHIHLQAGDVESAAGWWQARLGLEETHRRPGARFLAWGGYHHHIGLNAWRSLGAGPRDPEATGLAGLDFAIVEPEAFTRLASLSGVEPESDMLRLVSPEGIAIAFHRRF